MILTFLTSTQYLEKYQYSTPFLARRMGENKFKACVMCVKSNSTLVNLLFDMVGLSRHYSRSCVNRRKRMQLQLKYWYCKKVNKYLCIDMSILLATLNIKVCVIERDNSWEAWKRIRERRLCKRHIEWIRDWWWVSCFFFCVCMCYEVKHDLVNVWYINPNSGTIKFFHSELEPNDKCTFNLFWLFFYFVVGLSRLVLW